MSHIFNLRSWSGSLRKSIVTHCFHLSTVLSTILITLRAIVVSWSINGLNRLSPRYQDLVLDIGVRIQSTLFWIWLTFTSLTTVWTDITGRTWSPILVRAGRNLKPATVHLVDAESPLQLRLMAHFWRDPHDQTFQALRTLVARYFTNAKDTLDVTGVIVFPQAPAGGYNLPLTFRAHIDLVARTTTIMHSRNVADPRTGSVVCEHLTTSINSPNITSVLSPLLSRTICTTLLSKTE